MPESGRDFQERPAPGQRRALRAGCAKSCICSSTTAFQMHRKSGGEIQGKACIMSKWNCQVEHAVIRGLKGGIFVCSTVEKQWC